MKERLEKILAVICIVIMFLIGFTTLIMDNKQPALSEDENRTLQGMPEFNYGTVFEGSFASDFENYMIDRIPFRKQIIGIQNSIAQSMSVVTYEDTLNVVDTKIAQQMETMDEEILATTTPAISTPSPTPQPTPVVLNANEVQIKIIETPTPQPTATPDPNHFSDQQNVSIGFIDNSTETSRSLDSYETKNVIKFADVLIKINNLIKDEGTLTYVFALESAKARPVIASIEQGSSVTMYDQAMDVLDYYVPDNVNLISAPVLFEEPLNNGEKMYFFTDHHWTIEGAHYAYVEAMNKISIEPIKWEDYSVTYEYPYRGSYYRQSKRTYYVENPDTLAILSFPQADTFTRLLGHNKTEILPILDWDAVDNDRYRVYYNGPQLIGPFSIIETTSDTDRNALIIIDSYGIPFSYMLIPHYDNLCIMDLRYMYKSTESFYFDEIIETYDVDDVFLVLGDLNTYGSTYSKSLSVYMTNPNK